MLFYTRYILAVSLFFFVSIAFSQKPYKLKIIPRDQDTAEIAGLGLQTVFSGQINCGEYILKIPELLRQKGYAEASVDSIFADSVNATIYLFTGKQYRWERIFVDSADSGLLKVAGWTENLFLYKPMEPALLKRMQQRLLSYMENNGYPFASLSLDSIVFNGESVTARLKIEKGPFYKIDSLRIYGKVKLADGFMQRYLELPDGSVYRKEKLDKISPRLRELSYLEEEKPWDITMLGTGSILNLYLKQKRSSQVNGLIGFLPSNNQLEGKKLLVTGEFNLNLKNAFGYGESLLVDWQQLQPKSPRLNIGYNHPYLFNSPFGADFKFDFLKKDSSYLNLNFQLGLQYVLAGNKTGKVFLQNFRTNLLDVDTNTIKFTKKLPEQIDLSIVNLGLEYDWTNTDFRFNPRKGNEVTFTAATGTKKIRKNNSILQIKDGGNSSFDYSSLYDTINLKSYSLRLRVRAAHYFPSGKRATLKTSADIGWIESPNLFRNELFQIGGYKLLRGFDEESIFASRYIIPSIEYRYLLGQLSYFFVFADAGWSANKSAYANTSNTYLGMGIGIAFETKAGLFNLSFAAGKRNDVNFNLRQSKIHFGYVNYF